MHHTASLAFRVVAMESLPTQPPPPPPPLQQQPQAGVRTGGLSRQPSLGAMSVAVPMPSVFPAWAEPRYRCIRRISHAADATVWLVRVLKGDGGRLHVLKELHGADTSGLTKKHGADWLPREVELLTSQKHPFILPVVEMLRDAETGQMGMVTEYCDQGDLYSLLIELRRRGERVPETQVLSWLAQLCLALSHLHRQRILHRDVKTSNIFVTADRTLKLGDFGLARALQADSEAVISRVGSPFYMSPEICLNQPYSTPTDIWSLGCVLYEILVLQPAFYAENMALVLEKICSASYRPLPDGACSDAVRQLLEEMLTLDSTVRPSAQAVLSHPALRPVLQQLEPAAPPPKELRERLVADSDEVAQMRAAVRSAAAAAASTGSGGAADGDGRGGNGEDGSGGGLSLLGLSQLAERGLSLLSLFSFAPPPQDEAACTAPAAATLSPTPTHRAAAALLKSAAARDEAESAVRGMNDLLEASLGSATLEQALALASAPLAGEADEAARASWEGDRLAAIGELLRGHVLRKHARGVGSNGSEHADGTPPLTSPPPAAAAASSEPGPPLPPGQMASTDRSQQLSAPGVGRSVRPSELSASDETAIIAVARAVLALALWRAQLMQPPGEGGVAASAPSSNASVVAFAGGASAGGASAGAAVRGEAPGGAPTAEVDVTDASAPSSARAHRFSVRSLFSSGRGREQ